MTMLLEALARMEKALNIDEELMFQDIIPPQYIEGEKNMIAIVKNYISRMITAEAKERGEE